MRNNQMKRIVNECRNEIKKANEMDVTGEIKRRQKADIITYVIKELGISASTRGYHYLKEAILYLEESEEDYINIPMSKVYSEVACEFATTASRVERAIRHAIETGWLRGNSELQEFLFGYSIDRKNSKPTNSQFILTIFDALK